MQIHNVQSINPVFGASLKFYGETLKHSVKTGEIEEFDLKLVRYKFEKATKDINGTLKLKFSDEKTNPYIAYENGAHKDAISVWLHPSMLKDDFAEKLIKALNIFKKREKTLKKINKLRAEIEELHLEEKELSQNERTSSFRRMEKLFPMDNWREVRIESEYWTKR